MGRPSRGSAPPSRILDRVGLVAVALMLLGPLLAGVRLLPGLAGFVTFALGGLLALIVAVLGVIRAVRGRGFGGGGVIAATVGALAFVGLAGRSAGSPRINDFTTDPANPPAFKQAAEERANAGRDLGYPAGFAEIQRACCADLTPMKLKTSPAATFAMVELVARDTPDWTITRRDEASGELEAVATSRLFGFKDDVVVRVRPEPDGSRVDMRSKSRNGQGDLGTNAARIRAFEAALAARSSATQ
jgi:uncharacterized protein (DUF1499 family)